MATLNTQGNGVETWEERREAMRSLLQEKEYNPPKREPLWVFMCVDRDGDISFIIRKKLSQKIPHLKNNE